MARTFTTANRIITGAGSLRELGAVVASLGKRALVVTGSGALDRAGVLARARESLRANDVSFDEHPGVLPEPDLATVELLRGRLREGFVVAVSIGGGSVIDATKAAAGLAKADAPAREYQSGREVKEMGIPHVAVPTTAGTGAEVTPNAVIVDPDGPRKASIRSPALLPAAAIVDPELLLSVPSKITAESGMDALTQAIESYVSIHASPLTEALSLHAISLLGEGLVAAFEEGSNLEGRSACAYGALAAGMALANARLGVVHGLAHPIGIRLGLPHGQVCAILLGPSIRLNAQAASEKYSEIARRLAAGFSAAGTRGLTAPGLTQDDLARRAPRADVLVEALMDRLEIPKRIDGLGEEIFGDLIRDAMPSGSLKANPLTIAPSHLEQMLREVAA